MDTSYFRKPIPLSASILAALAIHGPLLMMELPLKTSYDANFHIFFASHYAKHWFNPWNEKWFAGFSQTTYPPLGHQWIAMLSYVLGLPLAAMMVYLIAVVLTVVGVYKFARLWVGERAAGYAAFLTPFLGAITFLVYSAGQLSTVLSAPLYLLALPYFYEWSRTAKGRALLKGVVLTLVAAAVHHVTLIFGSFMFALPVLWLACIDREEESSVAKVVGRAFVFAVLAGIGVAAVLAPYWIAIIKHPIEQVPIPHASRSNLLLNIDYAINYFFAPYGALILAFPFVVWFGAANRRLRPLMLGFWVAFLFALGGTTPVPKWLLGRAFEILTFERFTLLASILALPIVGVMAEMLIDRFKTAAAVGLSVAAIATMAFGMGWITWSPFRPDSSINVDPIINFMDRDGHDQYRYLTLGFGNSIPKIATYSNANSVDGEYNSARLLPEFTHFGTAQLTSAKFFGDAGMESLRAMLMHANRYGLKFIFVHDPYYVPLLTFTGWREVESFDSRQVVVWTKDDVPPAHPIPSDAKPTAFQGILWGTLPFGFSLLAILLAIFMPDRASSAENLVEFPAATDEHIFVPEAR